MAASGDNLIGSSQGADGMELRFIDHVECKLLSPEKESFSPSKPLKRSAEQETSPDENDQETVKIIAGLQTPIKDIANESVHSDSGLDTSNSNEEVPARHFVERQESFVSTDEPDSIHSPEKKAGGMLRFGKEPQSLDAVNNNSDQTEARTQIEETVKQESVSSSECYLGMDVDLHDTKEKSGKIDADKDLDTKEDVLDSSRKGIDAVDHGTMNLYWYRNTLDLDPAEVEDFKNGKNGTTISSEQMKLGENYFKDKLDAPSKTSHQQAIKTPQSVKNEVRDKWSPAFESASSRCLDLASEMKTDVKVKTPEKAIVTGDDSESQHPWGLDNDKIVIMPEDGDSDEDDLFKQLIPDASEMAFEECTTIQYSQGQRRLDTEMDIIETKPEENDNDDDDDFFSQLVPDVSEMTFDEQEGKAEVKQENEQEEDDDDDDDDLFKQLVPDVSEMIFEEKETTIESLQSKRPPDTDNDKSKTKPAEDEDEDDDDDFFSQLVPDVSEMTFEEPEDKDKAEVIPEKEKEEEDDDDDDLFKQLVPDVSEMIFEEKETTTESLQSKSPPDTDNDKSKAKPAEDEDDDDDDDFFSQLVPDVSEMTFDEPEDKDKAEVKPEKKKEEEEDDDDDDLFKLLVPDVSEMIFEEKESTTEASQSQSPPDTDKIQKETKPDENEDDDDDFFSQLVPDVSDMTFDEQEEKDKAEVKPEKEQDDNDDDDDFFSQLVPDVSDMTFDENTGAEESQKPCDTENNNAASKPKENDDDKDDDDDDFFKQFVPDVSDMTFDDKEIGKDEVSKSQKPCVAENNNNNKSSDDEDDDFFSQLVPDVSGMAFDEQDDEDKDVAKPKADDDDEDDDDLFSQLVPDCSEMEFDDVDADVPEEEDDIDQTDAIGYMDIKDKSKVEAATTTGSAAKGPSSTGSESDKNLKIESEHIVSTVVQKVHSTMMKTTEDFKGVDTTDSASQRMNYSKPNVSAQVEEICEPIEIRRKYRMVADIEQKLVNLGAKLIEVENFIDEYLDDDNYSLCLSDCWLRLRNKKFEMKVNETLQESSRISTCIYNELNNEKDVEKYLLQKYGRKLFDRQHDQDLPLDVIVDKLGFTEFATFETVKKSYQLDACVVDLELTDFGLQVCEVEAVADRPSQVVQALDAIKTMVVNLDLKPLQGV